MCEGWSCYQNSTGTDTPKSALEIDHVPNAEHNDPIKSYLSETIYTLERTSAQKDTSLLLLWRRSHRQELSVSSNGTPRTGTETFFSRTRKSLPSRGSVTTRTSRFMVERPLSWVLRMQGGHHPSYVMVRWGVTSGGDTPSFLREISHIKGVKLVPECIKSTCYKELWNLLTWASSLVRNGSSSRTQLLPTRPRRLRSGCGGTF